MKQQMEDKMALESFEKQISEEFTISAGFTNVAITGEIAVLSGSTVTAVDTNGTDATADVLYAASKSVSGKTLKIKVKAGTEALSPYKITFKIATSEGNLYEKDVLMYIKER
jgi:F0F1-type ATP synthase epsilon subunit